MSRKTIINQLKLIAAKSKNHWFDLHRADGTFTKKGSDNPIGIIRIASKMPNPAQGMIKAYVDGRLNSEIELTSINE